jgi:putative ABC transport system ATP-binding protein
MKLDMMTINARRDQSLPLAPPQQEVVRLAEVTRTFRMGERSFTALRGISLSFTRGEYAAIVGRSGSGKSTLLNMITGVDRPTTGTVHVAGTELSRLGESALATFRGRHIGIVFQFFQLLPALTIRENVLLAMELVNAIPPAEREPRMRQLLEQVEIAAHRDKLPGALSGGEQQRAAIARALANDPPLLVADEPTGNLDSRTAEAINTLFRGLASSGKTVLVVTHEGQAARQYDRVVRLVDGRLEGGDSCAGD